MTSYAMYVGRVGALAVALGVGVAVATGSGVAWASTGSESDGGGGSSSAGAAGSMGSTATGPATESKPQTDPGATANTSSQKHWKPSVSGVKKSPRRPALSLTPPTVASPQLTAPTDVLSDGSSTSAPAREKRESVASAPDTKTFVKPRLSKIGTLAPSPKTTLSTATVDLTGTDTPAHDTNQVAAQPVPRRMSVAPALTPASVISEADAVKAFLTLPKTIVSTATNLVTAILSSFVAPAPGAPPNPPLAWALLAVVRREFFNQTPAITYTASKPDALGNITISLNQTDADGDKLVYTAAGGAKGDVTLNADGHTLTYTPHAGETGSDRFTVTASDATEPHIHGVSGLINALSFGLLGDAGDTATRTVVVKLNTPPTLTATPGTPDPTTGKVKVTVIAVDPDGNPLTLSLTQPGKGAVGDPTLVDAASGTYTVVYTPEDSKRHAAAADNASPADKSDSFTITVSDGHGAQISTPVDVTVAPADNAPVFSKVTSSTDSAGKITGTVVFTDADNDKLTYSGSTTTDKGTVEVKPDGTITYTPTSDARFAATATAGPDTDTFTVTANDAHGKTSTTTLTVTITPADITSNPTAALAAAESVISKIASAYTSAGSTLGSTLAGMGIQLSSIKQDEFAATYEARAQLADARADQSVIDNIDDLIHEILNNLSLTLAQQETIHSDATAITRAREELTTPIETAADARAVIADDPADGKPIFSRVAWTSQPDGSVSGTVTFLSPNNHPLVYQEVGHLEFSTTQPGAFTYTPPTLPIDPKGPKTFLVFVSDTVTHIGDAQNITIDNTKVGVTQGTNTVSTTIDSINTLADLLKAVGDLDTSYADAVADRQAAIDAANAQLVAQNELAMAQIQQLRSEAMAQFTAGVLSGAITIGDGA